MINPFVEHVITERKRVTLQETVQREFLSIIHNVVMCEVMHLPIVLRTVILFNLFTRKC